MEACISYHPSSINPSSTSTSTSNDLLVRLTNDDIEKDDSQLDEDPLIAIVQGAMELADKDWGT